ncbi:MAG: selenocysteine-specific translation elongation factor [Candidatus Abyssubacteria bacterium]|nr:selenocysteine-specific translation elongation factor [Candidatus Abyssubacteria bacterium]
MKHLIVGTAGHIDHGKSALVKALTNIDPDRLKEEKERGLTIDLGFAYFDLPDGTRVAFVDVPGHERFVKNMLAGAAGMDIVILVVDATESVMPQTREHLDIMKLLGVSRGIVAVTKVDLADAEMVEIVEEEIKDLVEGSFLEGAPVVRVSSKTGEGLEEIRRLISDAVGEQRQKSEDGLFRFPIDRVFTMKGFGTVVTGTVFSGWLAEDEPVLVLPSGLSSRARQLQSHNVKQEKISAGMRGSLNLANISVQQICRGDALVRPGAAEPTYMLDAKVKLLPSAPRMLKRTTTVKLYVATSQRLARMTLIDRDKLEPGGESYAQLRLARPLCVFRGDRIVLRGESPEFTIGGGIVLDINPVRIRRKDRDRPAWLNILEKASAGDAALAFLSRETTGAKLREIAIRAGEPIEQLRAVIDETIRAGEVLSADVGDDLLVISRETFEALKERLLAELDAFFNSQTHRLFMPREELRSRLGPKLAPQLFEMTLGELAASGKIEDTREGVSVSGRKAQITPAQKKAKEKMESIYREAAFSPPTFAQAEEQFDDPKGARRMTSLLLEESTLTKISSTMAYNRDHLEKASTKIREHFKTADKLGVGDLKTLLGVSRKHAVPLLEYFDKIGLTTRVGDYRVLKEKNRK